MHFIHIYMYNFSFFSGKSLDNAFAWHKSKWVYSRFIYKLYSNPAPEFVHILQLERLLGESEKYVNYEIVYKQTYETDVEERGLSILHDVNMEILWQVQEQELHLYGITYR